MEDPLDFDISQGLVNVNGHKEVANSSCSFSTWNDNVGLSLLQTTPSSVLSFTLNGRQIHQLTLVESCYVPLLALEAAADLEDRHAGVVECLSKWIGEVGVLGGWQPSSWLARPSPRTFHLPPYP